jgi:NAD dependent epimerase/dehydratase
MTSVLVTGAAGFIGSHLVEMLVREGYRVRAFVHYNSQGKWHHLEDVADEIREALEIVPGDIADAGSVSKAVAGCDWVFHLAALIGIPYSYLAPSSYVQTNVIGTLNVLDACRQHGVHRMLHTSTSETYGSAQYVPINEKHPLVGQSPYSATKIGADKLAESYWLSFEMPTTIVRPFNTYGPRQSQRAIIPTIMTQALAGNDLKLGNLDPVRDLTFVTDTAAGFLAAARSEKVIGKTINLGVGSGVSIRELVTKIGRIAGREFNVEQQDQRIRPEGSEVQRLISDNRLAKELMDWEPKVSLDEGLRATFEHIQNHPQDYINRGYVV